jgi:hypothetical protein
MLYSRVKAGARAALNFYLELENERHQHYAAPEPLMFMPSVVTP